MFGIRYLWNQTKQDLLSAGVYNHSSIVGHYYCSRIRIHHPPLLFLTSFFLDFPPSFRCGLPKSTWIQNPCFPKVQEQNSNLHGHKPFQLPNLQMIPLMLPLSLESITLFAIKIASKICLIPTKTCWKSETKLPTTLFSLFARTLARSLYKPPTKLVGLKSLRSSVPPFFGTRT